MRCLRAIQTRNKLMKQNIKNPLATRQAAPVQPGRADSDFDAAKYTPAPLQSRHLPNEQWTQPAVGNPNVGIQAINDKVACFFALVQRNGDLRNVPELGVGTPRTAALLERYEAE